MSERHLVSLSDYLRTTYRPDRDYLNGEARVRHTGERPHAVVHAGFVWKLGQFERLNEVHVLASVRVRVSPDRIRVPDVCLLSKSVPREKILKWPPLLCVEVFSSNETLEDMTARAMDYAGMGVEHIWAADPWNRRGYAWSGGEFKEAPDGVLRVPDTPIRVGLRGLFARLEP